MKKQFYGSIELDPILAKKQFADLVDERRWDALQRRCAGSVDRVVVCSDLDARRAGVSNVSVGLSNRPSVPTS